MRTPAVLVAATVLVVACSTTGGSRGTGADSDAMATAAPIPTPSTTTAPSVASTPTAPPSPSPEPVVGAFDGERALAFATELADEVGPRLAGSEGDAQGQALIAQALRDAGWSFVTQPVDLPQGGRTQNIIAFQGAAPPDGDFLVVGGHHDTIGGGPGANDNASGIGVLVALAEELADEELAVPTVLIAFGAEEYQPSSPREHHVGSEAHAAAFGDRVVATLVVDMVGDGDRHCICWFELGPATLAERVAAVAEAEGVADRFFVQGRGDISDHGPYARRGIPAAFLWSGDDGRYHTPADTSEHLVLDDITRAGALTLAFLRDLRPDDLRGLQPRRPPG